MSQLLKFHKSLHYTRSRNHSKKWNSHLRLMIKMRTLTTIISFMRDQGLKKKMIIMHCSIIWLCCNNLLWTIFVARLWTASSCSVCLIRKGFQTDTEDLSIGRTRLSYQFKENFLINASSVLILNVSSQFSLLRWGKQLQGGDAELVMRSKTDVSNV